MTDRINLTPFAQYRFVDCETAVYLDEGKFSFMNVRWFNRNLVDRSIECEEEAKEFMADPNRLAPNYQKYSF